MDFKNNPPKVKGDVVFSQQEARALRSYRYLKSVYDPVLEGYARIAGNTVANVMGQPRNYESMVDLGEGLIESLGELNSSDSADHFRSTYRVAALAAGVALKAEGVTE